MRPLSSDVHRVVERLEDCIRRNGCEADLEVEMAEARVLACRHDEEPGSICGSVACVGGWYALVVHQRGEAEGTLFTRGGEEPSTCEVCVRGAPAGDQVLGFEDGADLMALHLGFDSQSSLTKWAHEHPDLWDNAHGAERFLSAEAFGLDWCAPVGLRHIVNHWCGVRDRLERLEASEALDAKATGRAVTRSDDNEGGFRDGADE